jgi:hypothetical protein
MNPSAYAGRRKDIGGLLIAADGRPVGRVFETNGIRKLSADQSGTANF